MLTYGYDLGQISLTIGAETPKPESTTYDQLLAMVLAANQTGTTGSPKIRFNSDTNTIQVFSTENQAWEDLKIDQWQKF